MFRKLVIAIMVFVVFVGLGFTGYLVADNARSGAAQTNATVTNETLTQEVGNYQLVSESTDDFTAGFNDSVTVYNESGHELTEGDDYQWNESDGAILYEDTASTQDGNTSNITYQYFENTQDVKELSGPLDTITVALGQFGYLAGGFGLVIFIIGFGAIVGKLFGNGGPRSRR